MSEEPYIPTPPAGVIAHRDLAYVVNGHERQKLDLYLPEQGENFPVIIWVHGGAFRVGSKEGKEDNPPPVHYAAEGYAVASDQLSPEPTRDLARHRSKIARPQCVGCALML